MSRQPTANDVGRLAVLHAFRSPGVTRPYPGTARVTSLWYVDVSKDAQLAYVAAKWREMDGTELQGARTIEGLRQIWELAAFAIGIPYEDTSNKGASWIQEALL